MSGITDRTVCELITNCLSFIIPFFFCICLKFSIVRDKSKLYVIAIQIAVGEISASSKVPKLGYIFWREG